LHAGRALPVVVGAALSLLAFCGLLAWSLSRFAHIDALSAYLATSPGGLDSVAIIAASTGRVDLPFVLALQAVRLLFVIGLSPLITRMVVRHSPHLQAQSVGDELQCQAVNGRAERCGRPRGNALPPPGSEHDLRCTPST
jgi:hypothetical protein